MFSVSGMHAKVDMISRTSYLFQSASYFLPSQARAARGFSAASCSNSALACDIICFGLPFRKCIIAHHCRNLWMRVDT